MTILQAIILGLVQGLTEFLPVSSSGHLVFFQKILNVSGNVVTFDIAVHLATLIAIFTVFYNDIWEMIKKPFAKFPLYIIIATIPAIVFALIFKDVIENAFGSGKTLAFEFVLTGLALLYAERKKSGSRDIKDMNVKDAVFIGCAQAISILPAVSRSGFTISGALVRGLNREFAAKFSFILSIPAILGAAVFDIKDIAEAGWQLSIGTGPLVAGTIAAAISGFFAIKIMLQILKKGSMKIFAYYVFAMAAIVLCDQLFIGYFFEKLF